MVHPRCPPDTDHLKLTRDPTQPIEAGDREVLGRQSEARGNVDAGSDTITESNLASNGGTEDVVSHTVFRS